MIKINERVSKLLILNTMDFLHVDIQLDVTAKARQLQQPAAASKNNTKCLGFHR